MNAHLNANGMAMKQGTIIEATFHTLGFSVASLWELPIEAAHVLAVAQLPPLHRDPFDRLLLAQAEREGLLLITADALVARYPCPVRHQGSF